jgi:ABC-type glycerol-3-phosphate transport system permease component
MNVRRVAGSIGATVLTVLWVAPIIPLVLAALGLPGAGTNGDVALLIGFDAFREVLAGGPIIAGGIGPYVANSIAVSIPAVFIPLVAGVRPPAPWPGSDSRARPRCWRHWPPWP